MSHKADCLMSRSRQPMFKTFRKFLPKVYEGSNHPTYFGQNDYRLATVALLVHTAAIDGNMSDVERGELHAVVKRQSDEATTDKLVAEAIKAEHEAVDFYHFASLMLASTRTAAAALSR
jgi:uncharacterized tellurite resistance protein B-like protein